MEIIINSINFNTIDASTKSKVELMVDSAIVDFVIADHGIELTGKMKLAVNPEVMCFIDYLKSVIEKRSILNPIK